MAKRWSKAPILSHYSSEGEGNGRGYTDPSTGLKYPSVTTVLKMQDKSGLVQWAATKVAEKIRDRPELAMGDPDKILNSFQYAHNEFRDDRAWVGTGIHEYIQAEHEGSWDYPELDSEQFRIIEQWEKLNDVFEIEPIFTELTLLNEQAETVGTADGIWRMRERIGGDWFTALIDIKTSRKTHPEHMQQLSVLAMSDWMFIKVEEGVDGAFEFTYTNTETRKKVKSYWLKTRMVDFEKVLIIHLREDLYDVIPVVDQDIHYDDFLCNRKKWGNMQELKLREKERNE